MAQRVKQLPATRRRGLTLSWIDHLEKEVEQAPGVGDGQRRLVHGVAELDTTELN